MVDVCLVLEGTWPYVNGGVASWVHQLITAMPHITFGVVHLGASPEQTRQTKFTIPPNVLWIEVLHLHSPVLDSEKKALIQDPLLNKIEEAFAQINDPYWLKHLAWLFPPQSPWQSLEKAFYSKETWEKLLEIYQSAEDQSFMDFLWTWRFTSLVIWRLTQYQIPPARLYHTISTGYAGFLASLGSIRHQRPMVLTEHGIYTRERVIDIQSAEWIYGIDEEFTSMQKRDFFRRWWIDLFLFLNRICYQHARKIYTLYEANRLQQIQLGADPDRCRVIPNGVVPENFMAARERFFAKDPHGSPTLIFAGRIVPIKDIKTLLKAFSLLKQKMPKAQLILMGPTDEDPNYALECHHLSKTLKIDSSVEWAGMVRLHEHLHRGDLMVLSSISEAQPLVLLEAACVGLPSVATDVGSCNELLNGITAEDRALGSGGRVVPVGQPEKMAEAFFELLSDPEERKLMGENAFRRVQKYYRQDDLISRYMAIYHHFQRAG